VPLSPAQRRVLEDWMRSKAIVMCPCCRQDKWRFAEAAYLRALLEKAEEDLVEAAGVVKVPCDNCGYVALFDAETIGVRGLWAEGREL
jgi:predicted nucleic-acid-binding Zn-ribbon protein